MFVVLGNDHQAVSLDGGTPGHEEQAPKVRKPYTITKQRERWTEEEHRQFLEAIKLHGRAWRRIQEHIGTKTAVQIRSHAQKYFTKVVRESSDAADGEEKEDEEEQEPAFKPADIPPPRPKRKPSHPYPRKLRASPLLPPNMQERPTASPARLQSPMAMMRESGSPTSVLSAADGSDTTGALSLCSNAMHHCSSTASFNNASSNTASALTELQSVCPPRVSSVEGEAGSTSPCSRDSISFTLSLDNNATMKNNRNTPKEDAGTKACLKLFGKTVVIDKPHKEGYLEGNSITEQPPKSSLGQNLGLEDTMDLDNETPAVAGGTGNKGACKTPHHQNSPVQQPSIHHGLSPGPMLFYLPVPTNIKNASQQLPYCTNPVVPWLAFCGGMPFPPIHCAWEPSKMGGRNVAPDDQEVPKEEEDAQEEEEEGGSSEGSNSPTSDGGRSRNNCSVVNSGSQENRKPEKSVFSGSRPLRPFPKKSKGFVPYKKAVIPTSTEQQLGVTTQGEVDRNY